MLNERSIAAAADPASVPERFLGSAKLRGIEIGLNIVCRVARVRPIHEARAMIWLVNYARHRRITADGLCDELDLDKGYIRSCLTDPHADLTRFVAHVAAARAKFEATIFQPVMTEPVRTVRRAFGCALEEHALVETIGATRMGKTKAGAEPLYLRHLDRCVWFDCPSETSDRDFYFAFGAALGIAGAHTKVLTFLRQQIQDTMSLGLIDLVIVDEAHNLWPPDPAVKPKRLEYLRVEVHGDGRVGVLVIATPQFSASLEKAQGNARWAPGQWDGRVHRYHLPDTMTKAELESVARQHAPEFGDDLISALVLQAMAASGFAGAMVNTIRRARRDAVEKGLSEVTMDVLRATQREMARGTKLEAMAKAHAAKRSPAANPQVRNLAPATAINGHTHRF